MKKITVLLFIQSMALAQTQVAFIEMRDAEGKIQQMEPGGRFSHVAISYGDQWLHSHPYRGVEVISTEELTKMGSQTIVVPLHEAPALSEEQIKDFIGKPAGKLSWNDHEGYYCSKLVGKLLHMYPTPMGFDSEMWQQRIVEKVRIWKDLLQNHVGELGLSPDDIYKQLQEPLYRQRLRKISRPVCQKMFL